MKTLFCFLLVATAAFAADSTGLQISGAGNILGQGGTGPKANSSQRIVVQEAEIMLTAPTDHLFDGRLSGAAHFDSDNAAAGPTPTFELHELWIGSSKLIARSRFRFGQFFLGFGRLNQFHRHDWPFTVAPIVNQTFFGDEGLLDSGFEYSYLTPLPFYLELTGGITSGWTFGHSHNVGAAPQIPTHYLRAVTYAGLPWNGGTQIGLNYIGRISNLGVTTIHLGVDATAKWNDNGKLLFLLQSEVWYRRVMTAGLLPNSNWGAYVFPQRYLGADFFLGVRFDYYSIGWDNSDPLPQYDMGLVPTLTWKPSEFSTFRLAYSYLNSLPSASTVQTGHRVDLQAIFILGAHPAHDF